MLVGSCSEYCQGKEKKLINIANLIRDGACSDDVLTRIGDNVCEK